MPNISKRLFSTMNTIEYDADTALQNGMKKAHTFTYIENGGKSVSVNEIAIPMIVSKIPTYTWAL